MSTAQVSNKHSANVSQLKRIRARSPQALARWTPVPPPVDHSVSNLGLRQFQEVPVRTLTMNVKKQRQEVELPNQSQDSGCEENEMVKSNEKRDRLRTKVRSVSRVTCILKKLRQEHPYSESSSRGYDEMQPDGMDSKRLMCKLDQRAKELEELLHEGEEILQNDMTALPCIETPSSAASMVFEDSIESPAKRSRNENENGFLSLSNSIDELCHQVSILSKECNLRRSEGFGTPHHCRTPERLQLLAETTDALHTIHAKVKHLANAHRKAECLAISETSPCSSHIPHDVCTPEVCRELNIDMDNGIDTLHQASFATQNSKRVHFHMDDKISASPAWTDFDIDDLPEDGLKAFPLACCPGALALKESMPLVPPLRQFIEDDSPSPSRVRTPSQMKSKDLQSSTDQPSAQVDQIQHDMHSLKHELLKAEIERKQVSESLAKQHRNIQVLENGIKNVKHCQQTAATTMTQLLPIEKRYAAAFCA